MTIEWIEKPANMLDPDHCVVVSPVNAVGVSGKGLAAQIKRRFPREEEKYVQNCRRGLLQAGQAMMVERLDRSGRWVAFLATKAHWRNPSRAEWVQSGVASLARILVTLEHKVSHPIDVALPRLGCGLGGLAWEETAPLIEREIRQAGPQHVRWVIYGPKPTR